MCFLLFCAAATCVGLLLVWAAGLFDCRFTARAALATAQDYVLLLLVCTAAWLVSLFLRLLPVVAVRIGR